MRIEKVPIDMSSEQKDILGICSKRQLAYVCGGGLVIYSYAPLVYKMLSIFGWIVGAIGALTSAIPVAFLVLFLGFLKVEKFNMNRDYYYWIVIQKKTQYGSWRKGFERSEENR